MIRINAYIFLQPKNKIKEFSEHWEKNDNSYCLNEMK